MAATFQNWAQQYQCQPRQVHRPTSVDDVQRAVHQALSDQQCLRVLGTGHSPSDMAMSDQHLLLLHGLDRFIDLDKQQQTVRVQAGISLGELNHYLSQHGLALGNLGSIDVQTVSGALATATHGTGLEFGVQSNWLTGGQLVDGEAGVVNFNRQTYAAEMPGLACHLGALGVFTELELAVSERFDLEVSERRCSLAQALEELDDDLREDHYRFWYLPHVDLVWQWRGRRVEPARASSNTQSQPLSHAKFWLRERLMGFHAYEAALYAATFFPSRLPSLNRLYADTYFKEPRCSSGSSRSQFTFDCLFKQHVNEWSIPIEHTADALLAIKEAIKQQRWQVHMPIEVRFVKGDDIWLSPSQGRDSCYIGVIAYRPYGRNPPNFRPYFECYEQLMAQFAGRPHWAKRFGPEAEQLQGMYPHWRDFLALRERLDPHNIFVNDYLRRVLGV